mmetsp:Transcript_173341/g.550260  ORF Transcript_173341/g.550260 Transcript_173341/m.550260 type:complete len:352 (-) Transcript_173341:315-1370(-)|eukprot:CAMPEP_0203955052 /NCGR_PEP_ID=MMETSP0359-20131031/87821_1 /ASSEMBLY_ACC=CAM_ASM_000338 /TAXON_ID=268821 /ORGANISM="Scrippsiella Hangoei, Strain SHTV-5" /LENGTH=351 /DNA_ID=CAMNT_0050888631 /DNA_START=33 /DNA_END=1088 /DNA_ORIENTATION=-
MSPFACCFVVPEGLSDGTLESASDVLRTQDVAGEHSLAELPGDVQVMEDVATESNTVGCRSALMMLMPFALIMAHAVVMLGLAGASGSWKINIILGTILLLILLPLEGLPWILDAVPKPHVKGEALLPKKFVEVVGDNAIKDLQSRCAGCAGCAAAVDDATCRRFLRARKGNLDDAAAALQKSVHWREEVRPGDITADEVQRELATGKFIVHGFDKTGLPIFWIFSRRHNKAERDAQETVKFLLYSLEQAIRNAESRGLEQMCIVVDLSGFSTRSMDYQVTKCLSDTLKSHYPERIGKILLWNAPSVFGIFWGVVRNWTDPVTSQKIQFVSGDVLFKLVDRAEHPELQVTY